MRTGKESDLSQRTRGPERKGLRRRTGDDGSALELWAFAWSVEVLYIDETSVAVDDGAAKGLPGEEEGHERSRDELEAGEMVIDDGRGRPLHGSGQLGHDGVNESHTWRSPGDADVSKVAIGA